jgi:hypothetical protein
MIPRRRPIRLYPDRRVRLTSSDLKAFTGPFRLLRSRLVALKSWHRFIWKSHQIDQYSIVNTTTPKLLMSI